MQLETMYSTVDERVATLMLNRPNVLNCANEQWARTLLLITCSKCAVWVRSISSR